MEPLRRRDVDAALAVVAAAATSGDEPFGLDAVDALVDAIPADVAAYVEWRFGERDCLRVSRVGGSHADDEFVDALTATCNSYPLRDVKWADSLQPLRLTDVVSTSALRRTAFYAGVMKPHGIEHELKLWLAAPPGHARYFELERGPGSNFTDREVALLSVLRPHLARVRARWELRPRADCLTERELEVLALVAQGLTNREIARRLFIAPATVRTHLEHVFEKLGVRSRTAAVSAVFIAA